MPAYDYAIVADIYDDFCVFDGDLEFFRDLVRSERGSVLELMAGTGRVSLPMLEGGARLTCVDRCASMLSVLDRKMHSDGHAAKLVCADVCRLPFDGPFQLIVLPFQGFTELVSKSDQIAVMNEAARLLQAGGRFVCTSHNPTARSATIDGRWHDIGRFDGRDGRVLALKLKTWRSNRPHVVEGIQKIEIFDPAGRPLEDREIRLEFSLVAPDSIIALAADAGLESTQRFGDYAGNAFEEAASPCFVAVFEKR